MTRDELLPHIPARLSLEEQEAWIQSVLETHPGHKTGEEAPMQPEGGTRDLDGIRRALGELAQRVDALKPAAAFDATGIERGLKAVQRSVASIPAPAPINLDGIRQSIGEMHAALDNLGVENRVAHRVILAGIEASKPIGVVTDGVRIVEVPKLIEQPAPVDRWKTPFRLAVLVLLAALFALSARGQADPATIIRDPAYKPSAGGASPAGSNGDVQMKSGAALAASPINCAGGTCTISAAALTVGSLTGVGKWTTGFPGTAAAGDIIGLWSGTCDSTTVLAGNGACATVANPTSIGLSLACVSCNTSSELIKITAQSGSLPAFQVQGTATDGFVYFGDTSAFNMRFTGDKIYFYYSSSNKGFISGTGGSFGDISISPATNADIVLNASGTGKVRIDSQKSTTGVRYVCIDTTGNLVSQAAACSGT